LKETAMLTIHGRATSLNVQAVMWTIAELGLRADRRDIGLNFGGNDTPAFLAMNPNGLVPVLQDGDVTMFESAAINRYLAARHGRAPFWPPDAIARAPVDMWAEWGKTTLQPSLLRPVFFPALHGKAPEPAAHAALNRNLDILEAQLAKAPFVLGADLTFADIETGVGLYRYFTVDLDRADHPRLAAYYTRLTGRPAYAEHVMVNYDVLRIRP
jgi:glutathione S-transferase